MQHILIKDKYGFFFNIVGDFFWGEEEGKWHSRDWKCWGRPEENVGKFFDRSTKHGKSHLKLNSASLPLSVAQLLFKIGM